MDHLLEYREEEDLSKGDQKQTYYVYFNPTYTFRKITYLVSRPKKFRLNS